MRLLFLTNQQNWHRTWSPLLQYLQNSLGDDQRRINQRYDLFLYVRNQGAYTYLAQDDDANEVASEPPAPSVAPTTKPAPAKRAKSDKKTEASAAKKQQLAEKITSEQQRQQEADESSITCLSAAIQAKTKHQTKNATSNPDSRSKNTKQARGADDDVVAGVVEAEKACTSTTNKIDC